MGKQSNKRQSIIILCGFMFLLALVLLLAHLNRPAQMMQSGTLTISRAGELLGQYTVEELQSLPYVEVEKEIVSSSSTNELGLWRGVPLRDLLNKISPELLSEAQNIYAYAEDAYVSSYRASEVALNDNILVIYAKDGQNLAGHDAGGKGPLRILVTNDAFGNRCIMYLCEIKID